MKTRRGGAVWIALGAMMTLGCSDDEPGVTGPAVDSIVLLLEADTLSVGATTRLQATARSADGETLPAETVTLTSSDEGVATVSDSGVVTAVGHGRATLTARTGDRSADAAIFVRRAGSLTVTPGDTTLAFLDTLRLTVRVLDLSGASVPRPALRSSSSNPEVFGGNLSDGFQASGVGHAVVTVETEGLTASASISVVQPVGAVTLLPPSLTLPVGGVARLTLVVRDTLGEVIPEPDFVRFDCDNCYSYYEGFSILSFDDSGLVTGLSPGSVNVFAHSRGVFSDSTRVTVR